MTEFDLKNYLYNNPLMEKKEDSKKGNKEEQKRMKGAIKDNEDHIDKLKKDIKADKKKLAKLKADEPKDVNEGVEEGMDKEEKKLTKEGLKDIIKEKIISVLNEEEITEEELEEGNIDYDSGPKSFLKKKPNDWLTEEDIEEQKEELEENNIDYDSGPKSFLKKEPNNWLTEEDIEEQEEEFEEEEDVDVDIAEPVSGESAKTDELLDLLTKAREEAGEFSSDPELGIQIGNVITYFTRQHVAKT